MNKSQNIHQGHRDRIKEKLMVNKDVLADHELLEVLLFGLIPRIDTNPIAHRLINRFGSLSKVLDSNVKELMSVDGVGKNTAVHIVAIGEVLKRINAQGDKSSKKRLHSLFDIQDELVIEFDSLSEEKFLIYLLDKKFVKITSISFENKNHFSVNVDIPEVASAIALHKPKYAIIAHNHPSGNAKPSNIDDLTTKRMHLICELHGVTLADHIIIAKDNIFSYYREGILAEIKQTANVEKLLNE